MQDDFERPESVEALAIMRLVSLGATTLEGAREFISIPEREALALRAFVGIARNDGASINYALRFRERVMAESEKLATAGQASEVTAWGTVITDTARFQIGSQGQRCCLSIPRTLYLFEAHCVHDGGRNRRVRTGTTRI